MFIGNERGKKKKNQLIFGKKRFSCTLVGAEERGSFREGSEKKRLRFLSRWFLVQ